LNPGGPLRVGRFRRDVQLTKSSHGSSMTPSSESRGPFQNKFSVRPAYHESASAPSKAPLVALLFALAHLHPGGLDFRSGADARWFATERIMEAFGRPLPVRFVGQCVPAHHRPCRDRNVQGEGTSLVFVEHPKLGVARLSPARRRGTLEDQGVAWREGHAAGTLSARESTRGPELSGGCVGWKPTAGRPWPGSTRGGAANARFKEESHG